MLTILRPLLLFTSSFILKFQFRLLLKINIFKPSYKLQKNSIVEKLQPCPQKKQYEAEYIILKDVMLQAPQLSLVALCWLLECRQLTAVVFYLEKINGGKTKRQTISAYIIVAIFIFLLGGTLGDIPGRQEILPLIQNYSVACLKPDESHILVYLTSMVALCYDRNENFTKFPGQQRLSFRKSTTIVIGAWALAVLLIPTAQPGSYVQYAQGHVSCTQRNRKKIPSQIAENYAMVILTTIWIMFHAEVIRRSRWAIYSKLKQHRQETKQVLSRTKSVKEVSLKKQVVAMAIGYSICWIPFSIAASLATVKVISLLEKLSFFFFFFTN